MEESQQRSNGINIVRQNSVCIPLSVHVKETVDAYFSQLNGFDTTGLHSMVISEVEKPLIQSALEYCGHNQTKASKILGLSRSTLRKKVEQYGLS